MPRNPHKLDSYAKWSKIKGMNKAAWKQRRVILEPPKLLDSKSYVFIRRPTNIPFEIMDKIGKCLFEKWNQSPHDYNLINAYYLTMIQMSEQGYLPLSSGTPQFQKKILTFWFNRRRKDASFQYKTVKSEVIKIFGLGFLTSNRDILRQLMYNRISESP